eukprot:scaffold575_cov186-Amphora_coffeaeformis.AAC.16
MGLERCPMVFQDPRRKGLGVVSSQHFPRRLQRQPQGFQFYLEHDGVYNNGVWRCGLTTNNGL